MSARYSIQVDPARDLVRVTLSGFLTPEEVPGYMLAREVAHTQLRCPPGQHIVLADVREMKILPQEVVAMFRAGLETHPEYRPRKFALVGAGLVRGQLCRMMCGTSVRSFADRAIAEAWLLQDDQAQAA